MRDATSAIVSNGVEAVEAEARHHLDHIPRHRAFRIVDVSDAGWFGAIVIAAQVRRDDGLMLGKTRRDLAPGRVVLWVAVQEKQRRPGARAREDECARLMWQRPRA
jgi:hypothetical protein